MNCNWLLEKYEREQYLRTIHPYKLQKDLNKYSCIYIGNNEYKILGRDGLDLLSNYLTRHILSYINPIIREETVRCIQFRKILYKLPEPDPDWLYDQTIKTL